MLDIFDVQLADLLPDSIRNDERVKNAAAALESEILSVTQAISEIIILPEIDSQPESVLDNLAYHFNVDFYDDSYSLARKREIIKKAIYWHRIKGTPAAVKQALLKFYDDVELIEWFNESDPDDKIPYTFRVNLGIPDDGISADDYDNIDRVVELIKNIRSHMRVTRIERSITGSLLIPAAMTSGVETVIYPYAPWAEAPTEIPVINNMLSAEYTADVITIYPEMAWAYAPTEIPAPLIMSSAEYSADTVSIYPE